MNDYYPQAQHAGGAIDSARQGLGTVSAQDTELAAANRRLETYRTRLRAATGHLRQNADRIFDAPPPPTPGDSKGLLTPDGQAFNQNSIHAICHHLNLLSDELEQLMGEVARFDNL